MSAELPQSTVTDERGVVRVTFMRPNLSGQKNEPINGTINGQNDPINGQNDPINILSEVEKEVLRIVRENAGISRISIVPIIRKSEVTVKRALRTLVKNGLIEYRGSKKTGGYFTR